MIRLIELRTEKGLSQRQMAKKFNISQGTYNNWENGRTEPSIEQLIALADFFETSVDDIVEHQKSKKNVIEEREKLKQKIRSYSNKAPKKEELFDIFEQANDETKNAIITLLKNT